MGGQMEDSSESIFVFDQKLLEFLRRRRDQSSTVECRMSKSVWMLGKVLLYLVEIDRDQIE